MDTPIANNVEPQVPPIEGTSDVQTPVAPPTPVGPQANPLASPNPQDTPEASPPTSGPSTLQGAGDDKPGGPLSKADQVYVTGLMKLLHSKDTSPHVDEMLKSGPPDKTIPQIAMQVNDQMEAAIGKKPELETTLVGGAYLVSDLVAIGNAGGFFHIDPKTQMGPILKDTMQMYIQRGLKDGSIDPVELQSKVEPMMNEEQKQTGTTAAGLTGISMQPTHSTAMASYGAKMQRKGMLKAAPQGGN